MLTADEKAYILKQAYVPEHCINLMTHVSDGEPFLIDDFFICRKGTWIILIGYPLKNDFSVKNFELVLAKIKKQFNPALVSLIAPQVPPSLAAACQEFESDAYFTLDVHKPMIRSPVKRNLRKAQQNLKVKSCPNMQPAHRELMQEFVDRARPSDRVEKLLFKMPDYVARADTAFVLSAWNARDQLAAFYVIDVEAKQFANYIIGCYSKKNYVLGASDLLLFELINISLEYDKHYIHLGLGVNEGIRRFKTKWGGVPTHPYQMCELVIKKPSILESIRSIPKLRFMDSNARKNEK